jgi:DNA repair exonuclease SbcCD ATPase subunit
MLNKIEASLAKMNAYYERGIGARDLLIKQKNDTLAALHRCRETLQIWEQVQVLFAKTSEYAREQLKLRIEETVTAALQVAGFPGNPRFKVLLTERAGQPAAEWRIIEAREDGTEMETSVEDSHGGGLVDVVSLALRLALLQLSRPKPAPLVILDEPGKHVSAEYAPNVAFFLKQFGQKTGHQVIMITHNETLAEMADATVRVKKPGAYSEVKQVG